MNETQRRYYKKNAEKIKARSRAHYQAKKKQAEECRILAGQLNWEIKKLTRINNNLCFCAILNLIALLFVCFVK